MTGGRALRRWKQSRDDPDARTKRRAPARALGTAFLLVSALACGFGTPGGGNVMTSQLGDDGGSGDDASGESSAIPGTTGEASMDSSGGTGGMTGLGTVTTPTSDAGDDVDPAGSSSGADESTSGPPPDPCANPAPQTFMVDVAGATVGGGMVTSTHPTWGDYAFSTQSSTGTVSFSFNSACEDTFWAWGLVYDDRPGYFTNADPDSFMVRVDASDATLWVFGCQTWFEPKWTWQSVNDTGLCLFENARMEFTVSPGIHTLHLQNVEGGAAGPGGGDPGAVAAIAAVVITNDPSYVP